MNYTSIEQSEKLLELGLSSETADMYWMNAALDNVKPGKSPLIIDNDFHKPIVDFDIPSWSVGALLCFLRASEGIINHKGMWLDLYMNGISCGKDGETLIACSFEEGLITALYKITVWLLENKILEKQ